jgi:hypothetical protein
VHYLEVLVYTQVKRWCKNCPELLSQENIRIIRTITSNAVVRVETNSFRMEYRELTINLKFIVKLLCMKENRYARICYQELFRFSKLSDTTKKNNWCLQVQDHFDRNAGYIAASTGNIIENSGCSRTNRTHPYKKIFTIRLLYE